MDNLIDRTNIKDYWKPLDDSFIFGIPDGKTMFVQISPGCLVKVKKVPHLFKRLLQKWLFGFEYILIVHTKEDTNEYFH